MNTSTYYNLKLVEGTDIVNPLTTDVPNYEIIDEQMHKNSITSVTLATEVTSGKVHALIRENSECSVIRFIATSNWVLGDTITVDGIPVVALLPSGEALPNGSYVINANVLCVLTGTNLTVYGVIKKTENANEIPYNDTNVGNELDKLNTSIELINVNLQSITNITNLQPNTEIKVGTFGGKELYRKIIIKDFNTSAVSETIHMFDETILSENVISINGICMLVEDNTCEVIPNNKIMLNINSNGKIYSKFTQDWTTSSYTWRYKLDVLYTK